MELLKLLSANEIAAQTICFLLLLLILRKFLWGKFLKVLDDRRDRIAAELKAIDDARLDVERMKEGYDTKLSQIEKAAKLKTEEAIAEGRRVAEELKLGAEANAQKLVENANAAIQDELAKAKEELKGDIIEISLKAAGKVIEEKLTSESDRRIVEEFLKNVDEA